MINTQVIMQPILQKITVSWISCAMGRPYPWIHKAKPVTYWNQRPPNPEACINLIMKELIDIQAILIIIYPSIIHLMQQ